MSPGARNSRIFALENMLTTSSSTLVSMASHLSEAEECERVFSGRGRWKDVKSLAAAKNVMDYLFNLASSSRYWSCSKLIFLYVHVYVCGLCITILSSCAVYMHFGSLVFSSIFWFM